MRRGSTTNPDELFEMDLAEGCSRRRNKDNIFKNSVKGSEVYIQFFDLFKILLLSHFT